MWEFTLRRGKSEALREGLATMNSPIIVTPAALRMLEPIGPELMQVYFDVGVGKSDAELALEIERRVGEMILHKVCVPNGLYLGACLFMALEYIKTNAKKTEEARH